MILASFNENRRNKTVNVLGYINIKDNKRNMIV